MFGEALTAQRLDGKFQVKDIDTSTVTFKVIYYLQRKPIYTEMTDPMSWTYYELHI